MTGQVLRALVPPRIDMRQLWQQLYKMVNKSVPIVALTGASVVGRAMLDIDWSTMFHSFADNLKPFDFLHGIYKSIVFGGAIAVASCYFGVTVRGGAIAEGRASNPPFLAKAVSIMLL